MKLHSKHVIGVLVATVGALSMTAAMAGPGPAGSQSHSHHFQPAAGLVSVVRQSTWQYRDIRNAAPTYALTGGCVSGDTGVMGVHYADFASVIDGQLDPTKPEILVYEPTANGGMRLVAVEYIIFADAWDAAHADGAPPMVMGQNMHYLPENNRYRLPASYILHVWAWKHNPNGMYANWNPRVTCKYYAP